MKTGTTCRHFSRRAVSKSAKRKEQDDIQCAALAMCALERKMKLGYIVDCCVLPPMLTKLSISS